jgi:WD40 repeat protein
LIRRFVCLQGRDTPMMHKYTEVLEGSLSRRNVLKGMAAFVLAMSLESCAQALSSSPSTPTPIPHRPGSLLYTYRGHTDRIPTVTWSPDGNYIVSGSLDKTAQVWATNPNEHFQPYIYRGHSAGVLTTTWSPDSKRIASGSQDKTIQVWDALSGGNVVTYTGHTDVVNTVAWSPNGNYIASGSGDSTLRVWDLATGKQMYVNRGHTGAINTIVWSPDSKLIVSGSTDKTVQILDAMTASHTYTFRGHTDNVSSVTWSPDGKYIASGSWDKTVQVWNAATGTVLYTYEGYNVKEAVNPAKGVLPDLVFAVAWSPNGERIAAITQVYCGDICAVVLGWDALTQKNFTFWVDQPVLAMAWAPDSKRIVTSTVVSEQGTEHLNVQPPDGYFAQISVA